MWPFKKRLKFGCPGCGFILKLSQKRFATLNQEGFVRFDHEKHLKIEYHMCHTDYMVLKNNQK
jgi:hypothetical protein